MLATPSNHDKITSIPTPRAHIRAPNPKPPCNPPPPPHHGVMTKSQPAIRAELAWNAGLPADYDTPSPTRTAATTPRTSPPPFPTGQVPESSKGGGGPFSPVPLTSPLVSAPQPTSIQGGVASSHPLPPPPTPPPSSPPSSPPASPSPTSPTCLIPPSPPSPSGSKPQKSSKN
jgi:hypothetical protein